MDIITTLIPDIDFIVLQTIAMTLTAFLLPHFKITSITGPFLTVIALAWFNNLYWDSALFSNLNFDFSSQTLILLLSNGLIFFILVKILPGIEISSIFIALLAPIIFSIFSYLFEHYVGEIHWSNLFGFLSDFFLYLRSYVTS